jgi:hypothetical protein
MKSGAEVAAIRSHSALQQVPAEGQDGQTIQRLWEMRTPTAKRLEMRITSQYEFSCAIVFMRHWNMIREDGVFPPVDSFQLGLLVTSAFPWLFLCLSTPPDALTRTPVDSRTCQA